MNIANLIAQELNATTAQVQAAIELLDGGDTVPFISRYRKEATGGLDDTQLRQLEERLHYLRELNERRQVILKSITEQNKLTPELEAAILATMSKATLEDLYLPYKPKRRTKAQIAREAGLEPLALGLWQDPSKDPLTFAAEFLNPELNVLTAADALEGARHILLEQFSEHAELLNTLREFVWEQGTVTSAVVKGKETEGNKFSDYFAYQETLKTIPSHRALAFFRGQREEVLTINLTLPDEAHEHAKQRIGATFSIQQNKPASGWLNETVDWTWRIKLMTKFELESLMRLREIAEEEAINVFASNLKHLLMAAPAGSRSTLALDPGLRTGVKAVVIDGTGKLLNQVTVFPHAPRNDWDTTLVVLAKLCKAYNVELISIGNGTASRETDKLVQDLKKAHPELNVTSIVVSEAGASVYSASELAAKEFPDLDVTYRGAVSIGRRLQDPLAELVKIEPKSIGVGQYQHDVNQTKLSRSLRAVMEDCVNAVGVDVNTASVPLLTCIAGLNETVAKNIVSYRDQNGPFQDRLQLKKVPRLGDKAFEQAAGFLRIANGTNPLDASAVHPEAYSVVERILKHQQQTLKDLLGNSGLLKKLKPLDYVDEHFGLPTVTDILKELDKPGRDPRPEFKTATFQEGIDSIGDLSAGMVLEGVVTNVANFGAFVDIGVHQDGLVHISMLSNQFVKNPHDVVKVGDIVRVKVLEVDVGRKRIQLTMRLTDGPGKSPPASTAGKNKPSSRAQPTPAPMNNALGNALMAALKK